MTDGDEGLGRPERRLWGAHPRRGSIVLLALVAALSASAAVGAAPPANDDFAAARELSGERGEVRSANVEATAEPGEPRHAGEPAVRSVWFRWTAPSSGRFLVDTCGSSFDTLLAVYAGESLSTLEPVASDDDGCGVASALLLTAQRGRSYAVAVDGFEGGTGAIVLRWSRLEPPANDAFAAATPLEGTGGETTGTVAGATREAGEPDDVGRLRPSVWYAWRPPSTGFAAVSVPETTFDSSIAVYVGESPAALQLVRADEDPDARTSAVAFEAQAGTVYRIAVRGVAALGEGPFTLRWARPQPPENDRQELARFVTGASGATPATTFAATLDGTERTTLPQVPGGAGSVWFAWRAPRAGTAAIQACGGDAVRAVAVFSGDPADAGAFVGAAAGTCGAARMTFAVAAGALVRVAILAPREQPTALTFTWGYPQPNDDFGRAADLGDAASGELTGTTVGATVEHEEPLSEGDAGSVWYAWRAGAGGWTTFDTCGSSVDTVLAVYTGDALPTLAQVARDDDSCGSGASLIRFAAERGAVYRLAVRGYGGDAGAFVLHWKPSPTPANDAFARAARLRGATGATGGTTVGTGREPDEPAHGGGTTGGAWYRWVAPTTRWYAFETCGSSFDTVVGVYRGSTLGALTALDVSDDDCRTQSIARFEARRGIEYRIVVTGFRRQDAFRLAWHPIAPPPCVVPNVVGRSLAEARRTIVDAHCRVGAVRVVELELVARGTVLGQEPRAREGVRRPHGTPVRLEVAGRR